VQFRSWRSSKTWAPHRTAGANPKPPVSRPRSHTGRGATGEKLYSKTYCQKPNAQLTMRTSLTAYGTATVRKLWPLSKKQLNG